MCLHLDKKISIYVVYKNKSVSISNILKGSLVLVDVSTLFILNSLFPSDPLVSSNSVEFLLELSLLTFGLLVSGFEFS